jgi:hypothetical protein
LSTATEQRAHVGRTPSSPERLHRGDWIAALLWLNYSAVALLYGAELNSELDRQADIRAAGGEKAGLIKPASRR